MLVKMRLLAAVFTSSQSHKMLGKKILKAGEFLIFFMTQPLIQRQVWGLRSLRILKSQTQSEQLYNTFTG